MKSKILIFLVLVLSSPQNSYCQSSKLIDSLTQIINTSPNDSVRSINFVQLGRAYFLSDLKKAMECFNRAIELGYKSRIDLNVAKGYSNKGIVYINMGEEINARSCLDSAMKYYKRIGEKRGIATVLANLGNLYYTIGDNTKSLEYQLACLKMREELGDKAGQAAIYNGIANIYSGQHENEKALLWYRKSIDLNEASGNRDSEVPALCNIGMILVRQNKLDEALVNYKIAMTIADSTNNKDGLATAYIGLSDVATEKGKLNDGILYIKKAEQLLNENGNVYKINQLYIAMGDIYARMGDYKRSIENYELLLKKGEEMGMTQYQKTALTGLTENYAKINNNEKAYQYLLQLSKLNDTLFNEEKIKQVAEMQTKFETERKEQENVILAGKLRVQELELSKNRYLMIGLGVLFFLSIVIGWLIFRQNKLKAKQTSIQLEQKLLRSQMNPHFIFNSLTTIESFIYEKQPKEAGRYLSDFARLMRLILENSSQEYIPLNKEIKTLEYYLVLQRLRLDDHLTYTIKTEGIEDIESISIPPMLTQPFIENAIEHGFKGGAKDGHIDIEFKIINKDMLQIQVTDNGRGINNALQNSSEKNAGHKSMAVQITRERLSVLNKSKRQKVSFSISDLSDQSSLKTGTMVLFTVPVV